MSKRGTGRALAAGLALTAAYLLAAGLTYAGHLVTGPPVLDDGVPLPPYRWVSPPADRLRDNQPARGATQPVPLPSGGSATTPDGQAQVLVSPGAIPSASDQTSVSITITPLDPGTLGPAPRGRFDSNAYRVGAAYEPSGAAVTSEVTVVLTYATNAHQIIAWSGTRWTDVATTPAGNNLLFASVRLPGIYAADTTGPAPPGGGTRWVVRTLEITVPLLVVVALLAVVSSVKAKRPRAEPG